MGEKKRTRCKYDVHRVGFTDDDGKFKSYSRCSMCGKWHKGQYGIEFDFNVCDKNGKDMWSAGKVKLCRDCAKKYADKLQEFSEMLWPETVPEDKSPLGKKIRAVQERLWADVKSDV